MIASISPERALRASGRFIVTMSLWPSCSTRQWGAGSVAASVMAWSLAKNKNVF